MESKDGMRAGKGGSDTGSRTWRDMKFQLME
jgi:hypothetical protein